MKSKLGIILIIFTFLFINSAFSYQVIELASNTYDFTKNLSDNKPSSLGPFPVLEYRDAYYSGGSTGAWTVSGGNCGGTSSTLWIYSVGAKMTTTTTIPSSVVIFLHNGDANDGIMELYVDGTKYARIDNNSNPAATWAVAVMDLPFTTHTLEVRAVGAHPGTSYVDIHLLGGAAADLPIPMLESLTPTSGPASGGTEVTLNGLGFLKGANVVIGNFPVFTINSLNFYQIKFLTPPATPGTYDVTVTNPNGYEGTLTQAYTYESPCGAPKSSLFPLSVDKNFSILFMIIPFILILLIRIRQG